MRLDRQPNRFRPGDAVVVKTLRQTVMESLPINMPFESNPGSIRVRVREGASHWGGVMWLTPPMMNYCGKEATVLFATSNGTYHLDICPEFLFPESMLEKDSSSGITAATDDELAVFLCLENA